MIGNPYLHITIFIPLLNDPIVFATRLHFHRNIDIFPDVLRQRNSNTSRINQRNFRQLSICHILIIVKEIIYKKAPMCASKICIIIQLILAAFNLIINNFPKCDLRELSHLFWIFIIETDDCVLNHTLTLKKLDIVQLWYFSFGKSKHSLERVVGCWDGCQNQR